MTRVALDFAEQRLKCSSVPSSDRKLQAVKQQNAGDAKGSMLARWTKASRSTVGGQDEPGREIRVVSIVVAIAPAA